MQGKNAVTDRLCYLFAVFLTGCLVGWIYEEIFYWITERRRRKAEDKKRLAEARQRELEADTAGEDKTAESSADDTGKSSEKPSKEK